MDEGNLTEWPMDHARRTGNNWFLFSDTYCHYYLLQGKSIG